MPPAFVHLWRIRKSGQRDRTGSLTGFIRAYPGVSHLRLHLVQPQQQALVLGAVWMAAGITYGAFRTRGFRSELVTFEVPSALLTEVALVSSPAVLSASRPSEQPSDKECTVAAPSVTNAHWLWYGNY